MSCQTTKNEVIPTYILPNKPQRTKIEHPPNQALDEEWRSWFSEVILYYDSLVQKWEWWAKTVEIIINPTGYTVSK